MLENVLKTHEVVMGLEVHAQLKTKTKLMSAASNVFGNAPNSSVSTPCTGMPGALPTLNKEAVQMAIQLGLSLGCEIQPLSIFSRKHYFYPDLPKGYQISQYDRPYALKGGVSFFMNDQKKTVRLTRIHMEEDAGKNLHFDDRGISLVDLNRSSVPLLEIVSEPDLRSPEEAVHYLKALRLTLRYLDICEGNLEEGNFRCDANVSIRKIGDPKFGTRVELKNINSFRNLERAVCFEVLRQFDLINSGEKVVQETRLWDAEKDKSISMRSKEEAADYRYFPEPDLLPLQISSNDVAAIQKNLPELPMQKMDKFINDFGRSIYDADVLVASPALATYYQEVAESIGDHSMASNFIQTNVLSKIQDVERDFATFYPHSKALSELLVKVKDKTLSLNMAKEVFEEMLSSKKSALQIIQEKNLAQVSDEGELKQVLQKVLDQNPGQLAEYRSGKDKLFGFFMGQAQKALQGKANAALLKDLLERMLKG